MTARLRTIHVSAVVFGFALLAPMAFAQQAADQTGATTKAADNTKMNERDRSRDALTPADQPNNTADIKLAAAVRSAIVGDDSLSIMAHNVKLIASAGAVTLRGPVKTDAEKTRVEELVRSVPGVHLVTNNLDIKQ